MEIAIQVWYQNQYIFIRQSDNVILFHSLDAAQKWVKFFYPREKVRFVEFKNGMISRYL